MKKIFVSFLVTCFLLLITPFLHAQENRTLNTKIADLLALMPANNLQQRDKLAEELISLGEEGFQLLADKMSPPGKGDNTAIVYAINGLTRYVSQPGREVSRAYAEKCFIQALGKTADTETKAFFMRQLKLVGTDKSVVAVASYLKNRELCEPATFVLTSVNSKTSKNELLKALSKVDDKSIITITKALGELQFKPANGEILKNIVSDDENLRKVSLASVAAIGAPESYLQLLEAAKKAGFIYEQSNATSAFVTYAQRLGETGENRLCKKACDEIIHICQSPAQLHTNAAALAVYLKYFEKEVQPKLLDAIDNNDKAFRVSVLNLVAKSPSASTGEWISKAKKAKMEIKAEIITMLGNKGDLTAADFIKEQFESQSIVVCEASISSYARLKVKEAVKDLTELLKRGIQPAFTAKTMLWLIDEKELDLVASFLDNAPENSKKEIIGMIGAKSGKRFFDQIYNYTGSLDPEIKTAAFSAMKYTSSPKDIDRLLKLLFATDETDKIKDIQDALVNASVDIQKESEKVAPLLKQLDSARDKERIIEVLPRIGGKEALNAVTGFINSPDQKVRNAAISALMNWQDITALASLYEICKTTEGKIKSDAFKGFVRLVNSSAFTGDQKLLQYRKIAPFATDIKDKVLIIKSIGRLKTFLSLVTVASHFEDADLKSETAQAVMEIALPPDGNMGLTGLVVRNALTKSLDNLSGSESEYDKAKIRKYLSEMSYEDGFVPVFNGKDLSGWQGLVGNPLIRKNMDSKELAKKQMEANLKFPGNWSVKDGCIVFNGAGDNLCSVKQYGDFEMIVDWKITRKGDSGIYLRGSPQVQIWDTSRVDAGAQVGSGGLYNNKINPSVPLKVADNPVGDWNSFWIKMVGDKVTVFLNGELVVDNVQMENYWDRSIPIFAKESIELQAHGTDLAFRDIYVKELNNIEYSLSDQEVKEGFKPLFNGRNFEGWIGNTIDYQVENGEIVLHLENGPSHGNIFTADEYSDFIYRFEFQLTPGANNGLGIRAPLEGDAAYVGMELQILDNEDPIYSALAPYQYHGSVYGVIAAKRGYLKPTGQWNYEEVLAKGTHIKVLLNGTVILDGDINEASGNGTADHKEHPGLLRKKGHIGFLGHGSIVKFKNIRLKDISNE